MRARALRGSRGFTLLELMVVVVVLTIVSLATFSGVHRDTFEASFRIFTDDIYGIIARGRNSAVEYATVSKIKFSADYVEHEWVDPNAGVWQPGSVVRINTHTSELKDHACVAGVYDGVQAPGMPSVLTELPKECMGDSETINFYPDGTFDFTGSSVGGAGVTVVIGDFRDSNSHRFTLIEVYPGGMVRKLDNVVNE